MPPPGEVFNSPFDELSLGDTLASRGRTVTEADIVSFAALSGDWTPLHTDEVAAAAAVSYLGFHSAYASVVAALTAAALSLGIDSWLVTRRRL